MNKYIQELQPLNTWTRCMFYKSQYVSHQVELSTKVFCGIVKKKLTLVNPGDNYNVFAR